MTNNSTNKGFRLKALVAAGAMGLACGVAQATDVSEASGILETVGDLNPNSWGFLHDNGFKVGGWLNGGVTFNANGNGMATTQGFNGGATFGDRADIPQLNQLYLYFQRAVATEGDAWDFGGRFDFNYGTDSIFTQSYGIPTINVTNGNVVSTRGNWDLNLTRGQYYDIALPQAYLESYIPIGNGLDVKVGHFYTPIGYEVVTAPDNFFYTHAYTMQFGEPFTHTGALGNYAIDGNWSAMGGVITNSATGGWDGGFNGQWNSWDGIAGMTYTTDDKATSFNAAGTYGGTSSTANSGTWSMYSLVLKHNILEDLHFVLQHDHGFANNVCSGGSNGIAACSTSVATSQNPQWYGIHSDLFYDVMDGLGAGLRVEWFRDNDGFRVGAPGRVGAGINPNNPNNGGTTNFVGANYTVSYLSASYYEVTLGLNWKPLKWLTVRPNARFDWISASSLAGAGTPGYSPFGYNSSGAPQTTQFLLSTDAIIMF